MEERFKLDGINISVQILEFLVAQEYCWKTEGTGLEKRFTEPDFQKISTQYYKEIEGAFHNECYVDIIANAERLFIALKRGNPAYMDTEYVATHIFESHAEGKEWWLDCESCCEEMIIRVDHWIQKGWSISHPEWQPWSEPRIRHWLKENAKPPKKEYQLKLF